MSNEATHRGRSRDVDLIARLSFGLRLPIIGPLETVDLGGLDLTQAIHSYLLAELDRSTEPAQLLNDKVARGELGAKAGRGFCDRPAGRLARTIRQRDIALLKKVEWLRDSGCLEGRQRIHSQTGNHLRTRNWEDEQGGLSSNE